MIRYIFDVDGTLTPSRRSIDRKFADWLIEFAKSNKLYYVTGSDRRKTMEQLGPDIYLLARRVYQCSGNDVWEKEKGNIKSGTMAVPDMLFQSMLEELEKNKFPIRTGNHIESRPGLCNFSIVGRNATRAERKEYVEYDLEHKDREQIAKRLGDCNDNFIVQVAGETGLDIMPKGRDKSQILNDFDNDDTIYFFGDKCQEGGNDYQIATATLARGGVVHEVESWEDTWRILKEL